MLRLAAIFFVSFFSAFSVSRAGSAEERSSSTGQGGTAPKILFLEFAKDKEAVGKERLFHDELRMAMDDMSVSVIHAKGSDYGNMTVGKQVEWVRPVLEQRGAEAAVWITEPKKGSVLLHVVVVSEGRALLRLVEAKRAETSEAELASAAREILSSLHVFETPKPKWWLLVNAFSSGGLVGNKGPRFWLGGNAGIERRITDELRARFRVGGFGGPLGTSKDLEVRGWAISPGVNLAYLWDLGAVALGPVIGVESWLSGVTLRAGQGPKETNVEWRILASVDLELCAHVTEKVDIVLGVGASGSPKQDEYYRASDDKVVYSTPFMSLEAYLGVTFPIN
jgi:hypothetical protein